MCVAEELLQKRTEMYTKKLLFYTFSVKLDVQIWKGVDGMKSLGVLCVILSSA